MKSKLLLTLSMVCLFVTAAFAQYAPSQVREIKVYEPFGKGSITNYAAHLEINTEVDVQDGLMNADGSDIRFTDGCADGTLYDYYIESGMNTTNTSIWVRIPTLASNDSVNIYMYNGDPLTTTPVSSFSATFPNALITAGGNSTTNISGNQYVGWLEINAGDTVQNGTAGTALNIYAGKVIINGVLRADGTGYAAPAPNTNGNGLGAGTSSANAGSGGGSYGGVGGTGGYDAGDAPGTGSAAYGTANGTDVDMGSSGGSGTTLGGNGGGSIGIFGADVTISATAIISANGTDGLTTASRGGGGGAGGGVLVMADELDIAGNITAKGGIGGTGTTTFNDGGGGGGGGRVKTFADASFNNTSTIDVSGGAGGGFGDAASGTTGGAGTVNHATWAFAGAVVNPFIDYSIEITASSPGAVCVNELVTLSAPSSSSYLWSTGETTQDITVSLTSTTTYTVTADATFFNAINCNLTAELEITVNPAPTVMAMASDNDICEGESITLMGMGNALNYTWDNGAVDNTPFAPSGTTTYTVTGTDANNCEATDVVTVTVNPLPAVTITASDDSVCAGNNVTLSGAGAANYSWDNGVTDAQPFSPVATTTYSVTGTDAAGCENTATVLITVNSLPAVTITASDDSVCAGNNVTLSGAGAANYSWDNGVTDAQPFTPAATATYTVTGTDAEGCENTATVSITVNTLPAVIITASDDSICEGNSVTLSGAGAGSYAWSNNVTDAQPFTPVATATYTVTGTDAEGCENTATVSVTVNLTPTLTLDATPSTGLDGTVSATVNSGTAPYTYSWSNGATTADINNLAPGNYDVTVTDANGCEAVGSTTIILVGLNDIATAKLFSIYPNPSNGVFNLDIRLDNETDLTVEVFNAVGQMVYSNNLTAKDIILPVSLPQVTEGTYYVRVRTQTATTNVPVIITGR